MYFFQKVYAKWQQVMFQIFKLLVLVLQYQQTLMENQYKTPSNLQHEEADRGFRKASLNITFGDITDNDQKQIDSKKVPTYTYHPIDLNFIPGTHGFITSGEMPIKSPKSLTSFAKINFSQRASSSSEPRASHETQQSDRMKYNYTYLKYQNNIYEPLIPEMEVPKTPPEIQSSQKLFSKYANSQNNEFNRAKSSSQFTSHRQKNLISNQYTKFVANNLKSSQKPYNVQKGEEYTNNELQQYKKKIVNLQREVTQINLEKGELIIRVTDLQRQNSNLKRELRIIQQNKNYSSILPNPNTQNKKIEIDEDLFYQIQNISLQQKQINKIKEEYIKLASSGYQHKIKQLTHLNNTLSLEIQSLKVELEMAKQDLNAKQSKIQFLQKETKNLQQISLTSSRLSVSSMSERSNQVISLRHSLSSLENKYRAVTKQLASKQDYIIKYITSRRSSQDLQAIKDLVSQNKSYSNSSQINPTTLDNSKQL